METVLHLPSLPHRPGVDGVRAGCGRQAVRRQGRHEQAQAVLDMKLNKLTNLEQDTILNDYNNAISSINYNSWFLISYQAIVVSLGAHLLMFYLYKFYTVGQIFPSYSLFPIFGIGLTFLIFGEIPTILFLVGSIIVLSSVFLLHKIK